jgi:purine-binding chemotaxis protein CheW
MAVTPPQAKSAPPPEDDFDDMDMFAESKAEKSLDSIMHTEPELQMVSFYLGSQEFTVPTIAVQEVIRYQVPAKLPSSPRFVAGVINLRGKMTPLVYLRDMLEVSQERKTDDRFIIVCRRKGLQFGLIIEKVHTMYRVPQEDIDWSIESHVGVNVDMISGLLKLNNNLVAIVSIDRVVDYVLEK